jgi:tellurite methyltransferase
MAKDDALRWNARYQTAPNDWYLAPRSVLTAHIKLLAVPGVALDVAMGLGANAEYLTQAGWRVIGVDISDAAVFQAKARCPQIRAMIADLEHFWLPPDHFDMILNFYYLDRALWPLYRGSLKPGGVILIETLLRDMLSIQPDLKQHFLLEPGELRAAFQDWQILEYHEGWVDSNHGHRKAVASLIARRP